MTDDARPTDPGPENGPGPGPDEPSTEGTPGARPARRAPQRKQMLLRLDPAIHDALARWANDEFRSANAQIEYLLRKALADAGRLPKTAGPLPRRGRPPKD
ncbi:hypothetical protein LRS74_11695 [Streptomyces sp. LX-29]|uniref:hypothetical protein n=1 Tax=Streptomyces sp. LX-29 TaxID=2900152 RepID=UPI00240D65F8|nr:hypothetical protein [Streptomyces sp. LX-29]WFB11979.1 hypothetical protein LRS74_11695 [Streptomyces sp. LX-29]